jgi:hypothetical protein
MSGRMLLRDLMNLLIHYHPKSLNDKQHFSWQPGPGFYGTYEFVFLKADGSDRRKVRLRIKILPKYIKEILEVEKLKR